MVLGILEGFTEGILGSGWRIIRGCIMIQVGLGIGTWISLLNWGL